MRTLPLLLFLSLTSLAGCRSSESLPDTLLPGVDRATLTPPRTLVRVIGNLTREELWQIERQVAQLTDQPIVEVSYRYDGTLDVKTDGTTTPGHLYRFEKTGDTWILKNAPPPTARVIE